MIGNRSSEQPVENSQFKLLINDSMNLQQAMTELGWFNSENDIYKINLQVLTLIANISTLAKEKKNLQIAKNNIIIAEVLKRILQKDISSYKEKNSDIKPTVLFSAMEEAYDFISIFLDGINVGRNY